MAIIHKTTTRRAIAAENLSEAEGLAVKKNAEGLMELATGAEDALGVVHVGGDAGDWVDYCLPGMPGIIGVRLAEDATPEDITEGTLLKVTEGGAFTAAAEGDTALAIAAEDATDGEIRDCLYGVLQGRIGDGSGKLYGLGHAVYTLSDPRTVVIRRYAGELAREKGREAEMELRERIERIGVELLAEKKGPACANVDFYSGFVYDMLDIPPELYTPLFAIARIAGWCAHRLEEVLTGGRIMRPAYRAVMERNEYVPLDKRKN